MAAPDKSKPTIVVRRYKKAHHAHHGGAWKIAYADFVTAMMAFFLLMWLLGSTSKGELNGIAEYFNSPMKVSMMGGSGSGDSSSVLQGGGTDLTRANGQVKRGDIEAKKRSINLQALRADHAKADAERMKKLQASIESMLDSDPKLKPYRSQILLDMTKDGLRIQIVDEQNRPMFDMGRAMVKDYMRDLLREIGRALNEVDNRIMLSGHTDASPYQNGQRGYSNWELSADRANASRRELVAGGMSDDKIFRVVGLASSAPFKAADPQDASNRRISIIVMNKEVEARLMRGGGQIEVEDADELADAVNPGDSPDTAASSAAAAPAPASATPAPAAAIAAIAPGNPK
jgi:chemotaxis protein MotB